MKSAALTVKWSCGVLAFVLLASAANAAERVLTIFAAASLTNVMQDVGRAYTVATGRAVRFSFAASSALARQIESGAPADVFLSADQEWMDYLQSRNLLAAATRITFVTNELVLIAPADSHLTLTIANGFPLAAALGATGRLATGDPASVPVGKYARAALTSLGVWSTVENRVVAADNVRTALNFVARGEAPLGVVYLTDARSEPAVRVVDGFPAASHDEIGFPAAALASANPEAAAFVRFLTSPTSRALFLQAGFGTP